MYCKAVTNLDLLNHYGIDEEGPVPGLQTNNNVVVPENGFQPSENFLQQIQDVLCTLDEVQDMDGILAYQFILQIVLLKDHFDVMCNPNVLFLIKYL